MSSSEPNSSNTQNCDHDSIPIEDEQRENRERIDRSEQKSSAIYVLANALPFPSDVNHDRRTRKCQRRLRDVDLPAAPDDLIIFDEASDDVLGPQPGLELVIEAASSGSIGAVCIVGLDCIGRNPLLINGLLSACLRSGTALETCLRGRVPVAQVAPRDKDLDRLFETGGESAPGANVDGSSVPAADARQGRNDGRPTDAFARMFHRLTKLREFGLDRELVAACVNNRNPDPKRDNQKRRPRHLRVVRPQGLAFGDQYGAATVDGPSTLPPVSEEAGSSGLALIDEALFEKSNGDGSTVRRREAEDGNEARRIASDPTSRSVREILESLERLQELFRAGRRRATKGTIH